jgi:hypothetical protein
VPAFGQLTGWSSNSYDQISIPDILKNQAISSISAAESHSLALTASGKVVEWGRNDFGDSPVYGRILTIDPSFQCQKLLQALRSGTRDTAILIVGDSTGNGEDEWVKLMTNWLAPNYPAYTVNYYHYEPSTGGFQAPTVVQYGTGPFTLNVYNGSVPGGIPQYFLGSHFGAISKLTIAPDLLIVSHGKNMTAQYSNAFSTPWRYFSQVTEFSETIWKIWPNAGFVWVIQAPNRDDSNMSIASDMIQNAARLRGFGIANVYDLYIKAGKPAKWYTDNLHPSAAGTQVYLQPWISALGTYSGVLPANF